ncbi:MAG: hypothetical protein FD180_5007 [Planctomycetota bacterium]|nr:MAG: hypothetical protein FD180_5007 [Planctomycetota bacterium]
MACPLGRLVRGVGPLPLLGVFVVLLMAALWGGLVRIGWEWPVPWEQMPQIHGALVVCGFLGGVIGVERAVALGRWWGWLAPACALLGSLALFGTLPEGSTLDPRWARGLFVAEATILTLASWVVLARQPVLHSAILAMGAASWLAGNALWFLGSPIVQVVPWWMGFLVLTIAAERLELSRMTRLTLFATVSFVTAVTALAAALAWATADPSNGLRALGIVFAALAAWLIRFDVARRTIRMPGLPRFIAVGLLSGYAWLAVAGVFLAGWAPDLARNALSRDFAWHAVFLGFVFSMIMAHAPVILPAVAGVPAAWTRFLYIPLAGLHATLAFRLAADAAAWMPGRQWGGLLNAASIVAFFVTLGTATLRARTRAAATSPIPHTFPLQAGLPAHAPSCEART